MEYENIHMHGNATLYTILKLVYLHSNLGSKKSGQFSVFILCGLSV